MPLRKYLDINNVLCYLTRLSPATLSAPMPNQLGSRPPAPANLSLHKSMASHSITFSDKAVRPLRMPLSVPS
jgi:hypothetical protein